MRPKNETPLTVATEAGQETQGSTDARSIPEKPMIDLISWAKLGAAVKPRPPRWRSRPQPASPINRHEETAARALYVLPIQSIRGSRK
jgi:hypothetical protein